MFMMFVMVFLMFFVLAIVVFAIPIAVIPDIYRALMHYDGLLMHNNALRL